MSSKCKCNKCDQSTHDTESSNSDTHAHHSDTQSENCHDKNNGFVITCNCGKIIKISTHLENGKCHCCDIVSITIKERTSCGEIKNTVYVTKNVCDKKKKKKKDHSGSGSNSNDHHEESCDSCPHKC